MKLPLHFVRENNTKFEDFGHSKGTFCCITTDMYCWRLAVSKTPPAETEQYTGHPILKKLLMKWQ